MDETKCVELETMDQFLLIGNNLKYCQIFNIVLVTAYVLVMGIYFIIMLFKNQIQ